MTDNNFLVYPKEDKNLIELTNLHKKRCELLGLNLKDPENRDTPKRCAKADIEQFKKQEVNFTVFNNKNYDQLILKKDINFSSLCSHHLYVYHGICSCAYIPNKKVCGLSKIARVVESLSKGAHSQEWLTQKICNFFAKTLKPKGVIVIVKARHTCESCRGVKNNNEESYFVTSAVTGVFAKNKYGEKEEFFNLLKI